MSAIAPSILSADFTRLGQEVAETASYAKYIHVDIMDGHFVPNITFGYTMVKALSPLKGDSIFDVHLMISHPLAYIDNFIDAGSDMLTIHVECDDDISECLSRIRARGIKAGISIKPGTDASALEPYLGQFDMLLVMTVEPGFGGQKMIPECLAKMAQTREMLASRGLPDIICNVDGGVNSDNVHLVAQSGADIIVAGNAVLGQRDRVAAFNDLTAKANG